MDRDGYFKASQTLAMIGGPFMVAAGFSWPELMGGFIFSISVSFVLLALAIICLGIGIGKS